MFWCDFFLISIFFGVLGKLTFLGVGDFCEYF